MSNRENYEVTLETLKRIPREQVKLPGSTPIDVYVQEALDLHQWCQRDMALLAAKGLAVELVEDLPIRCGALREAQSLWMMVWNAKLEAQLRWEEERPLAMSLRNLLVQELRFAFRNEPTLLHCLAAVTGSTCQGELIQDLTNLSLLGASQPELLAAVHFDTELLSRAAQTAERTGVILAAAKLEVLQVNAAKNIRDRGYTHLKSAVEEIHAFGRFLFRNDPRRQAGYSSQYLRKKRHARAAAAAEKAKMAGTAA